MKTEWKVGEIFEHNGEWYQCVQAKKYECRYCDLHNKCIDANGVKLVTCHARYRDDSTYVIFKKLEKVGEPYEFDGHIFQAYRTFEVPIFTENYATVREFGNNSKISIEIKQTKEDMEEKKDVKQTPLEKLVIDFFNNRVSDIEFEKRVSELYAKHSNSEKIGKNLKPFDLQKAIEGKPVCTRDGRKARIICFDAKCNLPIITLIAQSGGDESLARYNSNGRFTNINESDCDLMMLPEKKDGWVNVRRLKSPGDNDFPYVSTLYPTKEEATTNANLDVIDTIKIDWEE